MAEATLTKPSRTTPPNTLSVIYDPDRENLRPISGKRSVRTFLATWIDNVIKQGEYELVDIKEQVFLPGVNWIPESIWEKLQNVESVQQRIGWGALRIVKSREVGQTENTTRYDEMDAKLLVDNVYDLQKLESWIRVEQRPAIQHYIQTKIDNVRQGR